MCRNYMKNLNIIGRGQIWKRPVKIKKKPERIGGVVREVKFSFSPE